jgi:hypothetical protein
MLDYLKKLGRVPGLFWELLGDAVGLVSLVAFFYIVAMLLYAVQP